MWLLGALTAGCARQAIPAAAPPPAEVTVSRPLAREVTDWMEGTGTTTPLEAVDVRARVTGFLESVHFAPRSVVKPGDVLFTIDRRPFQNALASAEAALAEGASVVVPTHDADGARGLPDAVARDGHDTKRLVAIAADVASEDGARSVFAAAERAFGHADALVHPIDMEHVSRLARGAVSSE